MAKPSLLPLVTPIFTKDMGHRLALVRMRMNLSQKELARSLTTPLDKISQQTLAELETGKLRYGHFTVQRLYDVIGAARAEFVLFEINAGVYADEDAIRVEYWQRRLKKKPGQKKRGNPRWNKWDQS